ncbi:MAG: RNA methyltransferase [Deltaproteobacteria bacterium]|nr:RNA methyltransferase [Deltaproteobacteria bacterium]
MPAVNLDNIHIVLQSPKYPENIGSAARAMRNMGIRHLAVVSPENYDLSQVHKLATHVAGDVVEDIQVFEQLPEALLPFHYVVGTTARLGKQRQVVQSPEKLACQLAPISKNNQVAILFGPEDRGLSNEDLRRCHALVNIPTAAFSSLNLAQAVMIICYALHTTMLEDKVVFAPRLATRHQLDGMYDQLKDILVRISYINPENPDYFMNNLRHFFTRLQLRAKEVGIVRGICRQINWYARKCYEDGRKDRDA